MFRQSDGYEIEENFAGARCVENAVEHLGRARIVEFGLDERIFLREGVEKPLDVFSAGRSIPIRETSFFAPSMVGRVSVFGIETAENPS